jgi:uncharacterized protein YndB with AHSA1/START domain
MTTTTFPYELRRTVRIAAPRHTVFAYFTDPARWAAWWGAGSTIDAAPGGRLLIRYPNAIEAVGTVEAVEPPHRIVFTMGYPSGTPFPPEASRVIITLDEADGATILQLAHATLDPAAREQFVQGWRYQLSLFVNLVLDAAFADGASRVDEWFAALSEADDAVRAERVGRIAAPDVEYRDRYSAVRGVDDLLAQVGAMHRFMPGFAVTRTGAVRHRQGALLTDWSQAGRDGARAGDGAVVVELSPGGRVARVTMF